MCGLRGRPEVLFVNCGQLVPRIEHGQITSLTICLYEQYKPNQEQRLLLSGSGEFSFRSVHQVHLREMGNVV